MPQRLTWRTLYDFPELRLGIAALSAGGYELTPLKQRWRRLGRQHPDSGVRFGLCCVGSSLGLMVLLLALGAMSVVWMSVITAKRSSAKRSEG